MFEPFDFAQDRLRETSLVIVMCGNNQKRSEILRFAQNDIHH